MKLDGTKYSGKYRLAAACAVLLSLGAAAGASSAPDVRAVSSPYNSAPEFLAASAVNMELPAVPAVKAPQASSWAGGSFKSAISGANISYKYRLAAGVKETTVFSGGLALAESFESLFYYGQPRGNQFFLWFRGLPPSQWVPGRAFFEADARDLARFINLAAQKTGSSRVNLVLHSYSTLVLQKMVQLRGDAEVSRALAYLRGGQVLMLNATTHYKGSEAQAGAEYAQTAKVISDFILWLNTMDDFAQGWQDAVAANPALQLPVAANLAVWKVQREAALKLTSEQARKMMVEHLSAPWAADPAGIRQALLATVRKNVEMPSWQEALLRRTDDTAKLDFTAADITAIRNYGIKLDFVHAGADQLIPWNAERLTVELFGIATPEQLPSPGVVFRDFSGLFSLRVVNSDHYFPLKDPLALDQLMKK